MSRDEARKLLGGYATGSLTEAERTALFQAALEDQDLFDELAGEQALKEVLDEPGARQRLIAALEPPRKHRAWLWATAAATTAIAIVIGIVVSQRTPPAPRQIAQVLKSPEPEVAPAAPPVPRPAVRKVSPPAPSPEPPPELKKEDKDATVADRLQEAKPQADVAARGFVAAAPQAAAAPAAARLRAQNETVTVTQAASAYFRYIVRADGSLEIVILEPGFLSVIASLTKSEVEIFPSAAVAPPRTVRLQMPSDAIGLVIGFSETPGINDAPIQQVPATGWGFDLKPSRGKIRIQPTPVFLKLEPR